MKPHSSPGPDDRYLASVIAGSSLDSQTRAAAVDLFDDVAVLDRISLSDDSWVVCHEAARRSADLAENAGEIGLGKLVLDAQSAVVRAAAAARITDPGLLQRIVTTDFDDRVRLAAVRQIQEQDLLVRVAAADSHWEVRHAAVSKLDDQGALAAVALADTHAEVRYAAVMRLCDPEALEWIAAEGATRDLRQLAALRFSRIDR